MISVHWDVRKDIVSCFCMLCYSNGKFAISKIEKPIKHKCKKSQLIFLITLITDNYGINFNITAAP